MAGIGSSPSGSARPSGGRSRVKFFMFATLAMLGIGFFVGVAATKRAVAGPPWAQRLFGIELPPPQEAVVSRPAAAPPAPVVVPPTVPPPVIPVPENHVETAPPGPISASGSQPPVVDNQGFLGHWEISDEVPIGDGTAAKITSGYVFNPDGTGEFDANGKKMYGLRWTISGDFLTVIYDNDQAPQGDSGGVRLRWSVNTEKTLLTLAPENGKDARASLYAAGPGVYHKK